MQVPNYFALSQVPRINGRAIFANMPAPAIPPQFRLPQQQNGMPTLGDPLAPAGGPVGSSVVNAPPGMDMGEAVDVPVTGGPSGTSLPKRGGGMSSAQKVLMAGDGYSGTNDALPSKGVSAHDLSDTPSLTPGDVPFPKLGKSDLPLGGTYDGDTNTSSWLGGLINYTPKEGQSDADRMKLAGATLKDVANSLNGNDSNDVAEEQAAQLKQRQQQRAQDAMTRVQQALANANGDPNATRAALVQAALAGVDTGAVQSAMAYGKPSLKSFNRADNVYAVGSDGLPVGVLQRGAVDPKITGGVAYDPVSGTSKAIPGWMQQQMALANAKAAARANATANASAAAGALQMPQNPAYMFRRGR